MGVGAGHLWEPESSFYLVPKGGCAPSPTSGPSAVAQEGGAPNLLLPLEMWGLPAASGTPSWLPGYVTQRVGGRQGEGVRDVQSLLNQGNLRIHLSPVYKGLAFA